MLHRISCTHTSMIIVKIVEDNSVKRTVMHKLTISVTVYIGQILIFRLLSVCVTTLGS